MHSPNTLVVRCEDHRFADDESNINSQYIDEAIERLAVILGGTQEAKAVLSTLGWA